MKINEVEQATGITKKNIRFYEAQGLLKPSRNLQNSYRDYSPEDVRILQQIKLLRKLNIPISDIKRVQENYLTLDDCLRRHLITLERERKNAESVEQFCHELLAQDLSLENMDVEKLLSDMENLEEGGTRFMDVRRKDRRAQKKKALIAGCSAMALMLVPVGIVLYALSAGEIPLPVVLLVLGLPLLGIIGVVLALRERIKEIEGGELDEAVKY